MGLHPWYASSFLLLFIIVSASANWDGDFNDLGNNLMAYKTITVDMSGHGDFRSIQAAINSIPQNNKQWICIFVKTGTYREKVEIPADKPFIFLKGVGKKKTFISWDDHLSIAQSPTFSLMADNFVAKGVSFVNEYNRPILTNKNPRERAVAALVSGDKASFYACGFYGVQDTLWDNAGRHYFKDCTIQGAVDFIFGAGQSIYENCVISVVGNTLGSTAGYITAQGRQNEGDPNGFVFKNCIVNGDGKAYLGRPWRMYSRVLFYKTHLSDVVVPAGWDAWKFKGNERLLTYAEHRCNGDGAAKSLRVSWEKKLSPAVVRHMTSLRFIDGEDWLFNRP